jgi:hypothetical protein
LREAADRVPAWKRNKRRELQAFADANEQAALFHQSEQGLHPAPPTIRPDMDRNALRSRVLERSVERQARIGSMPERWDGRDSWAVAAAHLAADEPLGMVPLRELPEPEHELDLGL